jgi:hypothetical protein
MRVRRIGEEPRRAHGEELLPEPAAATGGERGRIGYVGVELRRACGEHAHRAMQSGLKPDTHFKSLPIYILFYEIWDKP